MSLDSMLPPGHMKVDKADIVSPLCGINKEKDSPVLFFFSSGSKLIQMKSVSFSLFLPLLPTPLFFLFPQGSKSYFHCDTGLITFGLLDDVVWGRGDKVPGTSHTSVELISLRWFSGALHVLKIPEKGH